MSMWEVNSDTLKNAMQSGNVQEVDEKLFDSSGPENVARAVKANKDLFKSYEVSNNTTDDELFGLASTIGNVLASSKPNMINTIKNYGIDVSGKIREVYKYADKTVVDDVLVRNSFKGMPRTLRILLHSEIVVVQSKTTDIFALRYITDYIARTILLNIMTTTNDNYPNRCVNVGFMDFVKSVETYQDLSVYKDAGLLVLRNCINSKLYTKSNDYLSDILEYRNHNARNIATLLSIKDNSTIFCGLTMGQNCKLVHIKEGIL